MQMAVETRTSLWASFFIVEPKGGAASKRMVTPRKHNLARCSKDFEHLWLKTDPSAKELEKEQLVKKQRNW